MLFWLDITLLHETRWLKALMRLACMCRYSSVYRCTCSVFKWLSDSPTLACFLCTSGCVFLAVHAYSICSPHTLGGQYDIILFARVHRRLRNSSFCSRVAYNHALSTLRAQRSWNYAYTNNIDAHKQCYVERTLQ